MIRENIIQTREDAGLALGHKLLDYKNDHAIVVAVPHGGVPVGSSLASYLGLPFEVMPCRKIQHPADREKTVATVTADEISIYETKGIPSDYIFHQTLLLRNAIRRETHFYYGDRPQPEFAGKVVIVVDDVLKDSDTVRAVIRSIRMKNPLKIIVAAPVTVSAVCMVIEAEADNFIYLREVEDVETARTMCAQLPKIDDEDVRRSLGKTNDEMICFI